MTLVPVDKVGSVGIVTDVNAHMLPPEAWTSGGNVRFIDGRVQKFLGNKEVAATPLVAPYFLLPVPTPSTYFWLYAGLNKISVYNGSTHTDLTRTVGGDYAATADLNWNGGLLGGIAILNNGVDDPQYWATPSTGTKMADLANWPANYVAKVVVPFGQVLVALNLTQSGTEYPHRVLWSHPADPGSVPASWDITDATKDAGETELSDVSSGGINAGVILGNGLLIYKDNSVWSMLPRGDEYIFTFKKVFSTFGAVNARSVVSVPGKRVHLVFTGDDLILHDGQQTRSILTNLRRRALIDTIDTTTYLRSFLVVHRSKQEIWFCYPEVGRSFPSRALIYNYETGTLGDRSLLEMAHLEPGYLALSSSGMDVVWDSISDTWDSISDTWNSNLLSPANLGLLGADPTNTKLQIMDNTNLLDGSLMSSFVEKEGLGIVGRTRNGAPLTDFRSRKLLRRIWPKMQGGAVTIKALAQEDIGWSPQYSVGMPFDPSVDKYVDLPTPLSGRLLGIRIESNADVAWEMDGYELELEVLGRF